MAPYPIMRLTLEYVVEITKLKSFLKIPEKLCDCVDTIETCSEHNQMKFRNNRSYYFHFPPFTLKMDKTCSSHPPPPSLSVKSPMIDKGVGCKFIIICFERLHISTIIIRLNEFESR